MTDEKFYDTGRFRFYYWLAVAYIVFWIFLILINHAKIAQAPTLLGLHLVILSMILLLGGLAPKSALLYFLNRWYPLLLLPLFFTALHYLVPAINSSDFDLELIKIDHLLTGTYPTVWIARFYHPLLTEIMQIAYTMFYFLPLFVLVPLYVKQREREFERVASFILLAFFLSYIGYLLFPALGPRFFLANLHTVPLQGYGFYRSLASTLNGLENIQWDAFPSGHITIALLSSYFAFKYLPKIFYTTLPIVVLLLISTIYLRYHYLIDAIAGIVLFGLVVFIERRSR